MVGGVIHLQADRILILCHLITLAEELLTTTCNRIFPCTCGSALNKIKEVEECKSYLLSTKNSQLFNVAKKVYVDTVENFILDGGIELSDGVISIDYNKTNESCWIDGDDF